MEKTNAMRILDSKKIKYEIHTYPHEEGVCVDGQMVAQLLGQEPATVFKTIVCISNTKKYYVCVIPVLDELDLKKVASIFRVKSLELIAVKDLLPITGYIRGGCSPIGMKKGFPTVLDASALNKDFIIFSGGKIGLQIQMNPKDLSKVIQVQFEDIRRNE